MKYKNIKLGLLLSSLLAMANAANIAYVPKDIPGDTNTAGAGKQWPVNRFVESGNCVIDNLTGLMWAKKGDLLGTGTWGSSSVAGTAQYKVSQMNTNVSATGYHLCGYSDWRLPNINELMSLVNYAAKQNDTTPAAWLNLQGFSNVQAIRYWSSTKYDNNNAWRVSFNSGNSSYDSVGGTDYIWPVRGGK